MFYVNRILFSAGGMYSRSMDLIYYCNDSMWIESDNLVISSVVTGLYSHGVDSLSSCGLFVSAPAKPEFLFIVVFSLTPTGMVLDIGRACYFDRHGRVGCLSPIRAFVARRGLSSFFSHLSFLVPHLISRPVDDLSKIACLSMVPFFISLYSIVAPPGSDSSLVEIDTSSSVEGVTEASALLDLGESSDDAVGAGNGSGGFELVVRPKVTAVPSQGMGRELSDDTVYENWPPSSIPDSPFNVTRWE